MNKLIIGLLALVLMFSPVFAQNYSGNLVNNSDFSHVRGNNASLPQDWYYIDFGYANNSYPIYQDNHPWNNYIALNNGLEFLEGYEESYSYDVEHAPVEMNEISTLTRRDNFYVILNISATGHDGYIYVISAYNSTALSDALLEITYNANGTATCRGEGNIVLENCDSSKNGNIIDINITYTIDTNQSNYTDIYIFSLYGILDGNVTIMNMSLISQEISADSEPPAIELLSPSGTYSAGTTQLLLIVNVTDNVLVDSCWYQIDAGANTSIPCMSGMINYSTTGSHTFDFYANDTSGNIGANSTSFDILASPTPPITGGVTGATGTVANATVVIFGLLMLLMGFGVIVQSARSDDYKAMVTGFVVMFIGIIFAAIMYGAINT